MKKLEVKDLKENFSKRLKRVDAGYSRNKREV